MPSRPYFKAGLTIEGGTIGQILQVVNAEGDMDLVDASTIVPSGHWKPLANGDPDNPAYLFSDGNGLETWVED